MPSRNVNGVTGSSPHTRGAPVFGSNIFGAVGIIPAYAGSTLADAGLAWCAGDHPRIRGEHSTWRRADVDRIGSSPHTRGARPTHPFLRESERIIPAYAGSTNNLDMRRNSSQDHPRIRGEHRLKRASGLVHEGSSPHTRGARGAGPMVPA